ncbi:hypothetical protein C8Q79DRAFT_998772 [Trametes meyenii]|nr:hypothetical protein C8Q79DRAFT_998772 [Trametes meyenii]
MPAHTGYSRLSSNSAHGQHVGLEPLEMIDDGNSGDAFCGSSRKRSGEWLSEAFSWKFFVCSCVVAIVLSAVNLSSLSASATRRELQRVSTAQPHLESDLKRPSVYLGLEKVAVNPSYCRSRGTFPKTFYTYDERDGPGAGVHRVHAPDDKMLLKFGGPIRAVVDTYVPDFGLENCTLSLRRVVDHEDSSLPDLAMKVDVYMLPALLVSGGGTYFDTLVYASGRESTTRPFHCPSRSHVFFEWRCEEKDCDIQIYLEGVTSMTASAASLGQSGFRITQYEALHCIR